MADTANSNPPLNQTDSDMISQLITTASEGNIAPAHPMLRQMSDHQLTQAQAFGERLQQATQQELKRRRQEQAQRTQHRLRPLAEHMVQVLADNRTEETSTLR